MGHAQRLRTSDVRRVFRLLGDVRELRHRPVEQEVRIVDGLSNLLGVSMGWAVRFDGFRPDRTTTVERFLPGTHRDPVWMRYLGDWGRVGNFDDDPLVVFTRPSRRPVDCYARSEMFPMRDWERFRIYEHVIDPASVRDTIVLWYRYPDTDRIRGYSFSRQHSQHDFTRRQTRIARLFALEMFRLYRAGVLEPPSRVEELPERLQPVLAELLTAKSQKQIAAALGLSYHTVRSYARELYDRMEVHSREELVTKVRGDGGPGA